MKKLRAAVILSGSGYLDGSEIREAVATLWACSNHGVESHCFAPDIQQRDAVNHLKAQPENNSRSVLHEAARIARGQIKALNQLDSKDFDVLIMPGGYGAAKNLSDFAISGSGGKTLPDLEKIIHQFHRDSKPIAAICISPAVLALSLKGAGLRLTVGENGEASQEIEKLGHEHVRCQADACVVDRENKVVTTPAYMYDQAPLKDVFTGIEKCLKETFELARY